VFSRASTSRWSRCAPRSCGPSVPARRSTSGQIPFTPRAKEVLELGLREAFALGHDHIGTEHILLGLVRENGGVAARVLDDFDADSEKIRDATLKLVLAGATDSPLSPGRSVPPNVAELASEFPDAIHLTPRARQVFDAAAVRSRDEGGSRIEVRDILHATTPLLVALGVDEDALRSAIARCDLDEDLRRTKPDD
jgi:ATP-dependent Clp protease ATP-binding subunit ClpA